MMSDKRYWRDQYGENEKTSQRKNAQDRKRAQRIRKNAQAAQRMKDQKRNADRRYRLIYQRWEIFTIKFIDQKMSPRRK